MINVMLVAEDTGEETVYGEVGPEDAWWSVPLPPCPACDGTVEWAEAGQVPGTRRCAECKRYYRLRTIGKFEPSDRYGNEVADKQETVYPGLPKQNILRQPKPKRRCIGCGGPAEMNASLGPSCPDCYDDLSG